MRKHVTNSEAGDSGNAACGYVSPAELAIRWRCSRSQVDRIARREGLTRVCLGTGRNGMVRYLLPEVEALESRHTAQTTRTQEHSNGLSTSSSKNLNSSGGRGRLQVPVTAPLFKGDQA
jgi:hypothetical protein